MAARKRASCSATSTRMSSGRSSHSRVEPSISVKRNVTVPAGASPTAETLGGHARAGLGPTCPMGLEFGIATRAGELEAVQRLRYAVYVEEMGRYREVEGADDSRFAEPEDQNSWIVFARDGADMVAASRTTWGGHGFSPRQIEQYQLAAF